MSKSLLLVTASIEGKPALPLAIHDRRQGDDSPRVGERCTFFVCGKLTLGRVTAVVGDTLLIVLDPHCEECLDCAVPTMYDQAEKRFLCRACHKKRFVVF